MDVNAGRRQSYFTNSPRMAVHSPVLPELVESPASPNTTRPSGCWCAKRMASASSVNSGRYSRRGRQTGAEHFRIRFRLLQELAKIETDTRLILRVGTLGRHHHRDLLKCRHRP